MNPSSYQPKADLLKDRVILVTGAGDGIGKSAALAYARHGATVVLHGRTISKLEAVYDQIEQAGGAKPAILPLQLSSATELEYSQLLAALQQQFGRLDGILHNAGILGERVPLEQYDAHVWDDVMNVNLRAPFVLTQALLPLLKASQDAAVVFTSSGVGRTARAEWGAYSVSKFGIEALSKIFAAEFADFPDIRFNCINPGATRTEMRAQAYPNENPQVLPTPNEIMPAYLYLIGPDSKGINGQSLDAQQR
ncbi:YciK family oxidoreductase [Alkanindiges sp. WGS2144]|uniref:YciK family oxidoreductase n=1 Tax=Alkanindiges sp. WGS2144 TaxID=3366808 RepID=UPI0037508746